MENATGRGAGGHPIAKVFRSERSLLIHRCHRWSNDQKSFLIQFVPCARGKMCAASSPIQPLYLYPVMTHDRLVHALIMNELVQELPAGVGARYRHSSSETEKVPVIGQRTYEEPTKCGLTVYIVISRFHFSIISGNFVISAKCQRCKCSRRQVKSQSYPRNYCWWYHWCLPGHRASCYHP